MKITTILMALSITLSGCAGTQAWIKDHRSAIRGTVLIAAREAGQLAASAVLQAAVGQLDKGKKVDFLQGLSGALWQQLPTAVNGSTVDEIVRAWTPNKPHWTGVAETLAANFEQAKPRSPEEVGALLSAYAEGLYLESVKAGGLP